MKRKILCTLGPSSMNDRVIARLEELGVSLFRLNLSHIAADQIAGMVEYLQSRSSVDICLDTEGAQIRTGHLVEPQVNLRENSTVRVPYYPVPGDSSSFNLYPESALHFFEVGDFITIDSGGVLAQVIDKTTEHLVLRVLTGGAIGRNKAATLEREIELPPLTEKDLAALAVGRELGIRHVALSFAHRASDVDQIRAVSMPGAFVISKIECLTALANLDKIAASSDALLIDRGDLSRQVPLEKIPLVQKKIIEVGKRAGLPVYVATNLMESMTTQPEPTRAEVNDVFNTLIDGADGLVLAGETAVGQYPIGCVSMIRKLMHAFENSVGQDPFQALSQPVSLLIEPHGGELVENHAGPAERERLEQMPRLVLETQDLIDAEKIAVGTYSPLRGFMDADTLRSVLEEMRLPDGPSWTMPIVLQVPGDAGAGLQPGQRVALCDASGVVRSLLDIGEIFDFDLQTSAERWFGQDAAVDPRIARLLARGSRCVAGEVSLVSRMPAAEGQYQLTPEETRYLFMKKRWNRVIAFHTHTLPHRVHEDLLRRALEQTHADGLYLSVETGALTSGDFLPDQVLRAYQILLDFDHHPRNRLILGAASSFSRGAGAREAGFLAITRRNMGFSHLLLGRCDSPNGQRARALLESLDDLAVEPVFFPTLGFDDATRSYEPGGRQAISGRAVARAFREGQPLPEWYVRRVVQDSLRAQHAAGRPIFQP